MRTFCGIPVMRIYCDVENECVVTTYCGVVSKGDENILCYTKVSVVRIYYNVLGECGKNIL